MKFKEPQTATNYELKLAGHAGDVSAIAVLPDNKRVLSASHDGTLKLWDLTSGACLNILKPGARSIYSMALIPDGTRVLSASGNIELWEVESGKYIASFKENRHHTLLRVAVTPDGKYALSGSLEGLIQIWDLESRDCVSSYKGHTNCIRAVAVTPDGKRALSASDDGDIKLWNLETQLCETSFEGHTSSVWTLALTPDGMHVLSGSEDQTLKFWDIQTGTCIGTFEGHRSSVSEVSIFPDGRLGISASGDDTIKIWNLETGACLQTLYGKGFFTSLALSPDGSKVLAGNLNPGNIYVYHLSDLEAVTNGFATRPEVKYTNAKVVLLGESGVGKSGLGYRLAEDRWVKTESTHGMKVWPLDLPSSSQQPDVEREIWLWDFAGQPEYRLVHQLFLDETSLALVLFDSQAEDPFKGLGDWEEALRMALGKDRDPIKLLIAARVDRGGATLTEDKIKNFCHERGFSGYFATSAKLKKDKGSAKLRQALTQYIPWERLPWISTTHLFKVLKDAIVRLKDEGVVLIRFSELRQCLRILLPHEPFKEEDLRTVVGLLAGQGLVKQLDFGGFVFLQPEQLNNYASAVIRAAREHVDGIGCINEQTALEGKFDFKEMSRLKEADEEILLRAMVQTFLDQSLCIREETPSGVQLVFPAQFNREIEIPAHPNVFVSYRFSGHLPTIYTTLVVRLTYSDSFEKKDLWKNAAEFRTPEGKTVGLVMKRVNEGVGEIKIFFEAGVPDDTRVTFIKYVHEHLLKRANNVEREREYTCPKCNETVENRRAIKVRLEAGKTDIVCEYCDTRVPLLDLIERKFNEDRFLKRVQELDTQAKINLDNESRELILVGQAFAVAGEAMQIFRPTPNSDHGIDGEIEFKDNEGRASGKRIYLQLKSGDSYLYKRRNDGQDIFTIKKERHLKYWRSQAYPVYLVIRTSDATIRWMNVTEYLQRPNAEKSKRIVFKGEPFTAAALMALRDEYIQNS